MKTLIAMLAATAALLLSSPADAFREVFRWQQPHDQVTTLTVPMRGGLLLLDAKRAPTETQWIRFRINTGDYFEVWGKDHIFVLLDGYFNFEPNVAVPYAARGIILDRAGIHVENFVDQSLAGFVPVLWRPATTYEVIVHVSQGHVAGWVTEITPTNWGIESRRPMAYTVAPVPDQTPGKRVSLIVIGALADFTVNPPGTSARLQISRLEHGRFVIAP